MSTASDASALTAEGTAAYRRQVEEAASTLRSESPSPPSVGILRDLEIGEVLGADTADVAVPCADIPHYPTSEGTVKMGRLGGTRVAVLDQHQHLYEGHTPREVAFPVRMLAAAGMNVLLLSGAAGSVNPQFHPGEVMLITDHINFQGLNPLVGPNVEAWGPRFPDMTEPYDAHLREKAQNVAREEGFPLQKGVYLSLLGPNPETAAEHRMARRLGADAIGTRIVPEVIAARHMDVRVMTGVLLVAQHRTESRAPVSSREDGTRFERGRSRLRSLLTEVAAAAEADVATGASSTT